MAELIVDFVLRSVWSAVDSVVIIPFGGMMILIAVTVRINATIIKLVLSVAECRGLVGADSGLCEA